ncbi:argininosuccinate lyase [bacterium BMS3Bbin12]|nr:argininosuccinate lyase [bacterium BMS3Abin12]GBE49053.1 argininosuccinate lyase [bacterium BMS3Bbin12]GBE51312.1 argininosuccinate lyase [bacterium BMS3Bbin13]
MSTILWLCPSHRDHREISILGIDRRHRILFHDYASIELERMVAPEPVSMPVADVEEEIGRITDRFGTRGVEAVVSTDDYPGSTLAAIAAEKLGLAGVSPGANLLCQHKYHCRSAQRAVVPSAVPAFESLTGDGPTGMDFPLFIKPIKSFFSVGAYRVDAPEQLPERLRRATLPERFFDPMRVPFERYTGLRFGDGRVIAEELLGGVQATVEGYAFNGEVCIFGIVDSVMFPGTFAFRRFDYPSGLPESVQGRMKDIAEKVMHGIGFDNGVFNIEFMYDDRRDRVHIIEINPRMASQFSDLYEKVDGWNSYEALIDLALGRKPSVRRGGGRHRMAASCVLRTFEDRKVLRVPSPEDVAGVLERYPDARIEILATVGENLSEEMQDGESYRYGVVSLGGRDIPDILETLDECCRRLDFVLGATSDATSHEGRRSAGASS